ncbi:hypothetical protein FGO68_gene14680 [Halteria grandinella]|uniref:Uncharacterized protein n=1 Tax=Halteria grandinella TaxID=5974 RepID=A0A8J8P0B7_HALGN|nr:hypothetical protein FGO68_gene14680 [Halteria grandinella]
MNFLYGKFTLLESCIRFFLFSELGLSSQLSVQRWSSLYLPGPRLNFYDERMGLNSPSLSLSLLYPNGSSGLRLCPIFPFLLIALAILAPFHSISSEILSLYFQ